MHKGRHCCSFAWSPYASRRTMVQYWHDRQYFYQRQFRKCRRSGDVLYEDRQLNDQHDRGLLPNTTAFTRVAGSWSDSGGQTSDMWIATVTATGASTVTITTSASVSATGVDLDCLELSNGCGSAPGQSDYTSWRLDHAYANQNNTTASTTIAFPATGTPANAGNLLVLGHGRASGGGPYYTGTTSPQANLGLLKNANNNLLIWGFPVTATTTVSVTQLPSTASYTFLLTIGQPVTWPITGSSPSSSHASGALGDTGVITGSAISASAANGTISALGIISGSSSASSSANGTVKLQMGMGGTAISASSASGSITAFGVISGSAISSSAGTGTVICVAVISGFSNTSSSAAGSLTLTGAINGSAAAVSSGAGTVYAALVTTGSAASTSSAAGAIGKFSPLAGSAASASSAAGTVYAALVINGSSVSSSSGAGT